MQKELLFTKLKDWADAIVLSKHLVLVEGINDSRALCSLGVPKKQIVCLSGRPLYLVVEEIASKTKNCIVLTDLDKKGRQLFSRLSKDLIAHHVRINNAPREFLYHETKIRQIESISRYC